MNYYKTSEILQKRAYIDNLIIIKQSYLNHLKSIDLNKYSFPNEYKNTFNSFKSNCSFNIF